MKIRVLYNILLVIFRIRAVLPVDAIRRVKIKECGEELILLPNELFFILNKSANIYGRRTVIQKLLKVEKILEKKGFQIGVFEIYRDKITQKSMRAQEYEHLKKEYPLYSNEELEKILNRRVANTTRAVGGGHQTGGALDLTLCTKEGIQLDMGTEYLEFNEKTKTCCKTLMKNQLKNRELLLKLMKRVGFVNYPNEWWHFSYGDQMWAAYKYKGKAIYGDKCIVNENYLL